MNDKRLTSLELVKSKSTENRIELRFSSYYHTVVINKCQFKTLLRLDSISNMI